MGWDGGRNVTRLGASERQTLGFLRVEFSVAGLRSMGMSPGLLRNCFDGTGILLGCGRGFSG